VSVEVYLNDGLADLGANQEPPLIFKRAFDPDELASPAGDRAISLKLPRTLNNMALLGNVEDVQQSAAFARLGEVQVRILVEGVQVLRGTLLINRITPTAVECGVVGDNITWAQVFAARSLREIESLPCIDYSATANQGDGVTLWDLWQTDEADGFGVQFPLVSYGNFPADPANTNTNPINGVTTIAASAGVIDGAILDNRSAWPIDALEVRPAAYVRPVLQAMFEDAGYDVEGDFFTDPNFADLVVPFTDSQDQPPIWNWGRLGVGQFNAYAQGLNSALGTFPYLNGGVFFRNAVSTTTGIAEGFFASSSPFNTPIGLAVGQYRAEDVLREWFFNGADVLPSVLDYVRVPYLFAPEDGSYRMTLAGDWIDVFYDTTTFASPTPARAIIYIRKMPVGFFDGLTFDLANTFSSGNDLGLPYRAEARTAAALTLSTDVFAVTSRTMQVNAPGTGTDPRAVASFTMDTGCVTLKKGECLVPFIVMASDNESVAGRQSFVNCQNNVQASVTGCGGNDCLSVASVLPDANQADFLRWLVRLFNLYIETDEQRKRVGIFTREKYMVPQGGAIEIEAGSGEIRPPSLAKTTTFSFAPEDGEALFAPGRYDVSYTAESENLRETAAVETGFAATAIRGYVLPTQGTTLDLPTLNTLDELNKVLGELGDASQQVRLSYTPRILKWKGLDTRPVSDGLYIGGKKYRVNYPTDSGNFTYPKAVFVDTGAAWVLSFADERSLLTEFYARELRERERGLEIRVIANVDAATVRALGPRVPVTFGGQVYRLLEIEGFDPTGKRLTKIRLAKA
jgi:hypothetical protein